MLRYLPLILKNCWRNRRRTILTIASVGISMCLLGVVVAMYRAFYMSSPTPAQALRLITRNRISLTVTMPLAYQSRIEHTPGVRVAMISNWFGGTYKDARDPKNQFPRFAVEPEKLFDIYGEYQIPQDQKHAFLRERTACVISRGLAERFGFQLGDHIHLIGDIYPGDFEFTIRGIFDSPPPNVVMYFNKEYLDQSLSQGRRGEVGMYFIRIDDPRNSARIAEAIDRQFRNSPIETRTESEQAFVVNFLTLLGDVKLFLMAIAGAVTFTILLVSANTMAMSVRERVPEVGVLKTLGFAPATVLGLILGEAGAISIAGGILGYLLSTLLMQAVAHSPFGGFVRGHPFFDPTVALVCVLIAALTGLLSSLPPALGAARTPIVDALRRTE